ncbi:hypothetical protein LCGC14_1521730, partial [marine sediment metagenome]
ARKVGERRDGTMRELLYSPVYDENTIVLYGDFESDPHTNRRKHIGYLLCIDYSDESIDKLNSLVVDGSIKVKYHTKNAFQQLGDLLDHRYVYIIYFHNLTYDKSFIFDYVVLDKNGYWGKSKGNIKQLTGHIINNKGKYVRLILKCSYHMIRTSLKNFKEWFNLDIEKEVWMVELSTLEVMEKQWVYISEALSYIKSNKDNTASERKEIFLAALSKLERDNPGMYISGDKFNFKLYTEYYCLQDCKVLKLGMEAWRQQVYEISGGRINLYDLMTLPQLGYNLLYISGAFDNVYEFRLHVRDFMSKATKGGVCCTAYNAMWKVDIQMEDLDVNQQYPHAMIKMGGVSMGLAKVLNTEKIYRTIYVSSQKYLQGKDSIDMLNKLSQYDYSSLQIYIYGVNRTIKMPIISIKVKKINNYDDSYVGIYYCDINELKALIVYQNIIWSLVRGYYFDEGRNNRLSEVVTRMCNLRNTLRSQKNGMQAMIKELNNSGFFGRMIMKPIRSNYIIIYMEENLKNYINRYNKFIKYWIKISSFMYMVKTIKSISTHYAMVHGGNNVLSQSKMDIYLVRDICDKNGIIYLYGDTDSLHVEHAKLHILELEYKKQTGRELIEKEIIGQYSSDYKFDKLIKKGGGKFKYMKGYDNMIIPIASSSYYIWKKVYINQINITYPEVEYYNLVKQIYYHIRCKGIGGDALVKGIVPILEIHKQIDPMKIYELMYQGIVCLYDVVKGGRISFQYKNDLTVCTRNNYYRIMHYDQNKIRYHIRKDRTIIEDNVYIMNTDNQELMKRLKNDMVKYSKENTQDQRECINQNTF